MEAAMLSGRVALVTGAGLRVGRAIALALAGAGADLAVHYRSSRDAAEEVGRQARALGRRASVLRADLSLPEECRRLMASTAEELGGIDFLIHSASNFHRAPLSTTTDQIWDDAMNVNARAAFLLARDAAAMLSKRRGRIVLISDLMASDPPRDYLAHSVSKAAVEGLVRALAAELAPDVSVNGVAPGTILPPEGTPADQIALYARKTLLGRNGDPEDIANTVLFLCSGPSFITGQILRVDGGQSIR